MIRKPHISDRRHPPAGFTLVELLVVITIIILVSAVTLPTILPALNHRQVGEAARILQAALVGARDAAIRDNAPRGIRLLVDPVYNGVNTTALAYNRFIPIETPGDYTTGRVSITYPQGPGTNYTRYLEGPDPVGGPHVHPGLRIDEAPFDKNGAPNERTSWFWNIRIGDKIRFNDAGRYYTIVGPAVINPRNPQTLGQNPELFVNDGAPGSPTQSPNSGTVAGITYYPEYLYLVNGEDDNNDGFVDNGWDGFNNDYNFDANSNSLVDEFGEWANPTTGVPVEPEQFTGTELTRLLIDPASLTNIGYTILRRPTPVAGSREVTLPGGVVVDATTWNSNNGAERSRLPIDPRTLYVDILVNSNGQVVPSTQYSSLTASNVLPFYHFWLTERQDVHEPTDLWGAGNGNPNATASNPITFLLPLPQSLYSGLTSQPTVALQGERALITLFARTGHITSNSIEVFSTTDVNAPFYAAQSGSREAK